MAGIGRVAENDENSLMLLDFVNGAGLVRKHPQRTELLGGFFEVFQRIGQEDIDAFVCRSSYLQFWRQSLGLIM